MKKSKRIAALFLSFVMVFTMTAYKTDMTVYAAKKVTVNKVIAKDGISGSKKMVYVAKGKTKKLKVLVKAKPKKAASKKVKYRSSNKKIVTVNAKGIIKGVRPGSAKITVVSNINKKKKAVIKVKVTKVAVQSVKLNKKSGTVEAGGKLNLKATVSAKKGAVKKVAWSSNNTKVAKVNNKGVVTAVKAGNVTITAKAIDGSGKKAACKLKVTKEQINLKDMTIVNNHMLTFSLSKPCGLNAGQVVVMKKNYMNGTYRRTLKVESLTTSDQRNYSLILKDGNNVSESDYVKLSIPGLTGSVKEIEKQYLESVCNFTEDSVVPLWTGSSCDEDFYFNEGYGYSKYEITGLPAGLTAEDYTWGLNVKGVPTKTGVTKAVMTAIDEYGNQLTKNIYFAIGSDTVMAGAVTPRYLVAGNTTRFIYISPNVVGGSGNYDYKIISDPQNTGAYIDEDDDICASVKVPGTYNVTVRATDRRNSSLYCDFNATFYAIQGITIGGCIKDAQGMPIDDASIEFTNKDRANRYCSYESTYVDSSTGTYSTVIAPGNYDITVSRSVGSEAASASTYRFNQSLTTSKTGFDFELPLYKVLLVSNDENISETINYRDWYLNDEYIGYGNTLYLRKGTYNIESNEFYDSEGITAGDWFNGIQRTESKAKYKAAVTVVNTAVQTAVSKVKTSASADYYINYPAAKDTNYWLDIDDYSYYDTPEIEVYDKYGDWCDDVYTALKVQVYEQDNYTLASWNGRVKLYDINGEVVEYTGDSNSKLYMNLQPGIYYIGTGDYNIYDDEITMSKIW